MFGMPLLGFVGVTIRRWPAGVGAPAGRRRSARQWAAFLLLTWLVNGLLIMSLTRGWLGSVPFHEHLGLGAHDHGAAHRHAHDGDPLDRALGSLTWLGQSSETAGAEPATPQRRVVSLRSASAAQFAFSSFAFVAVALAAVGLAAPSGDARLAAPATPRIRGRPPLPLSPPPRPA